MTRTFALRENGAEITYALAEIGHVRLTGFVAWCAWLFVHVMALVGFRNRVAVLLERAYAYLTYQRSARFILQD